MNIYLGIDTGGTFTDFVLICDNQFVTHKVLSTPHAPEEAILTGLNDLALVNLPSDDHLFIIHGSTVATNAVLEGKGVSTVFITNHGFKDMLSIGRQARHELYNLQPENNSFPVDAEYCIETGGRLCADGEELEALSDQDIALVIKQIKKLKPKAVAINLLFSYLDDRFEKKIEHALNQSTIKDKSSIFISRSSNILPEYKEYERGMTTWLNAYVGPLVKGYLARLQQSIGNATISVMQSAGNTIAAEHAGAQAVHMLLSGPAGGLAAAHYLGQLTNNTRMLTFDMGGTSTDVALIEDEIQLTNESKVAGYPVAIPMVDMHTIGAGGGSIASIDEGGLLQVGPQSAGANPGPACYGQGGLQATVTDANLILGLLLPDAFLGGGMTLDLDAATKAVSLLAKKLDLTCEQTAQGIIKIANEHMVNALRVMSVQRGVDPRGLTLTSFGGAGGLHVCALATALQIKTAMVPVYSGVLSAFGMLVAPRGRELSKTINCILANKPEINKNINSACNDLIQQAMHALEEESVVKKDIAISTSLDCRYQGQSYTLNTPFSFQNDLGIENGLKDFINRHQQRYGHTLDLPIELVNIRVSLKEKNKSIVLDKNSVTLSASAYKYNSMYDIAGDVAIYHRKEIAEGQIIIGPALITETTATTFVDNGWQCEMDSFGNLLLFNKKNT